MLDTSYTSGHDVGLTSDALATALGVRLGKLLDTSYASGHDVGLTLVAPAEH